MIRYTDCVSPILDAVFSQKPLGCTDFRAPFQARSLNHKNFLFMFIMSKHQKLKANMPIKEFIWFYIKTGVQLNRLNWSRLDFLSHRNFWTCGTLMRHNCWTGIPMECLQLTPKMVLWLRYTNFCFILVERNQSTMSTIQVVWEARIGKSGAIISMDLVCQWLSIPLHLLWTWMLPFQFWVGAVSTLPWEEAELA